MPTLQYPKNPNTDTAFVVQDDGTKNRALMIAPQDISTLELPSNPNSTKGYVTVDGKKQRVILVADVTGGGGDQHNMGYYATLEDLQTAYPTAEAGDWAIVGSTDTVWIWDDTTSAWVDSDQKGQVTSVNGQTGAVTLGINDVAPSQTGNAGKFLQTDGTDASWQNAAQVSQPSTMPTLAVADWVLDSGTNKYTQTVNVTGVTATNVVYVAPFPANADEYAQCNVLAVSQGAGTIGFQADVLPTNALGVNVVVLS